MDEEKTITNTQDVWTTVDSSFILWLIILLFLFFGWNNTPRTENEEISFLKGQVIAYENILKERKGE